MGPIERFFTGVAAAIAAATAQNTANPPSPPPTAIESPGTAPAGPVPLPTPRPGETPETVALASPADPGALPPDDTPEAFALPTPAPDPEPETPLPAPRPGDPADPVIAAIAPPETPPAALPPPAPEPNPRTETASAGLTALPEAAEADEACRLSLAQLAVEATPQPPIAEGVCGIAAPLEILTIGLGAFAVELQPAATVDCSVAGALSRWLEEDVQPAAHATLGEWIAGIRVAGSYACRGRNNDPEAQLSEHAFGNAIDVSAFRLADGTWVEVQPFDDDTVPAAQFLAEIRSDACGPFTTVLGPGVALHDDHFHLDLAARGARGQSLYCP